MASARADTWTVPYQSARPARREKHHAPVTYTRLTGDCIEPVGGGATAAFSGRSVAQILCHEDGRDLTATRRESDDPQPTGPSFVS